MGRWLGFWWSHARLGLTALALLLAGPLVAEEIYQAPDAFLAEVFSGPVPDAQFVVVSASMRADINRILGHSGFRAVRVRYWSQGARTAWILDEIGKYEPITTGIVVDEGAIETLRVLIYRESHGWEVRHAFFTDQFKGLTLDDRDRLSERVDGISGATLSVNALRNLARVALYLDGALRTQGH